jgi:Fe-S oxidoreductase
MFREERCDFCGECLARCKYMNFTREEGAREFARLVRGGQAAWLSGCITCFACNETCPRGARPFDLILERMEAWGKYVDPKILQAVRKRFTPADPFKRPEVRPPVLSLCTVESNLPFPLEGKLFRDFQVVRGRHFFCNVLFPHLGNESILKDGLGPLVERYASLGVEEIVFLHDDCYSLMAGIAPMHGIELPFRPVHIFEYLVRFLKEHREEITPLRLRAAYQRPCASRLTPWKDPLLDEIFRLIGVERVSRTFDREEALCCGQDMKGMVKRGVRFPELLEENVRDAVRNGAQAMVYLCPMCLDAMGSSCTAAGLKNHMIVDLCRLALGESPGGGGT